MASSSCVPPPTNVIDISLGSDSESDEDYPREWIRIDDPRFVGRQTRRGRTPFGPGFNKDITEAQAVGNQCLMSNCISEM